MSRTGYNVPMTLVSGDTGKIECISLDWESDNIYLVDSRTPKIEVFTTHRFWRRTIVGNNQSHPHLTQLLEKPRALDVVPAHGLVIVIHGRLYFIYKWLHPQVDFG